MIAIMDYPGLRALDRPAPAGSRFPVNPCFVAVPQLYLFDLPQECVSEHGTFPEAPHPVGQARVGAP